MTCRYSGNRGTCKVYGSKCLYNKRLLNECHLFLPIESAPDEFDTYEDMIEEEYPNYDED